MIVEFDQNKKREKLHSICHFDDENIKSAIDALKQNIQQMKIPYLNAPQIGHNYRIIAFQEEFNYLTGSSSEIKILVDPIAVKTYGKAKQRIEGMFGLPKIRVKIYRYPRIKVRYYDKNGNQQTEIFENENAAFIQQSIDLFDGFYITDKGEKI